MPRYYFHVCNGNGFEEDEVGQELSDAATARITALEKARLIMAREMRHGVLNLSSFIEVENKDGADSFTVNFPDAVQINQ